MLRRASSRLARWVIRRAHGDSAVADGHDDAIESPREVALRLGEECHFFAVEIRILEADRALDHADEHEAAAMSYEVEAPFHRRWVASRVEHDIKTANKVKRHLPFAATRRPEWR